MTRMTSNEYDLLKQAQAIVDQSLATHDSPEKQLYQAALKLIENPRNWCQGKYHRVEEDWFPYLQHLQHLQPYPVVHHQYCSIGAITKARDYLQSNQRTYVNVHMAFHRMLGVNGSLVAFNDSHTHDQVIALWYAVGNASGWR